MASKTNTLSQMNILKLLLFFSILSSCINTEKKNQRAGDNEVPKQKSVQKENISIDHQKTLDFIPKGYEIVTADKDSIMVQSDLNGDKVSDYAILLSSQTMHNDNLDSTSVVLAIFEGHNDGSYQLKHQSGNLTSAFIHSVFDDILKVKDSNVLSLKHQSMRHDYELKFRYDKKYDDFILIESEYKNYGRGADDSENIKINFLTGTCITTTKDKKSTTKISEELKPLSAISDDSIYILISSSPKPAPFVDVINY